MAIFESLMALERELLTQADHCDQHGNCRETSPHVSSFSRRCCPGGDRGSSYSDESTPCYSLQVDILKPDDEILDDFKASQQVTGSRFTDGIP